jgi:hypothetical protein
VRETRFSRDKYLGTEGVGSLHLGFIGGFALIKTENNINLSDRFIIRLILLLTTNVSDLIGSMFCAVHTFLWQEKKNGTGVMHACDVRVPN